MPVIGYFAGKVAADYITSYDHWIAFILLGYIGVNMIIEKNDECELVSSYSVKKMFTLAVATSIDALAVGVSLAFLNVNIWFSSILIGVVTFAFSFVGGIMGFKLGENFRTKSTIIGGIVLCLLGIKILLEGSRLFIRNRKRAGRTTAQQRLAATVLCCQLRPAKLSHSASAMRWNDVRSSRTQRHKQQALTVARCSPPCSLLRIKKASI
jgi:putative Mn2+ efflux pump MntP